MKQKMILIAAFYLFAIVAFPKSLYAEEIKKQKLSELFESQIIANSHFFSAESPTLRISSPWTEWSARYGWPEPHSVDLYFALIKVDTALLKAAAQAWAAQFSLSSQATSEALNDLEERYIKNGRDTFLLIASNPDKDHVAFSLGGPEGHIVRRSRSGNHQSFSKNDPCIERIVYSWSPTLSCVLSFDKLNDASQPYYYVDVPLLFYRESDDEFHPAKRRQKIEFKVEPGDIPLLSMIDAGADFNSVTESYGERALASIRNTTASEGVEFVTDVAVNVASSLLLRAIKL